MSDIIPVPPGWVGMAAREWPSLNTVEGCRLAAQINEARAIKAEHDLAATPWWRPLERRRLRMRVEFCRRSLKVFPALERKIERIAAQELERRSRYYC